ncbi:Rpn family recombination-promoting nuclease/putative transposase [Polyangium sp. 6x1]|uniref:Rpn family recombination-promoting nuclease/putative transposase n=1 Tax=Polyangium sp. 6x1 TaxID=3042689 RepID=UPI0024822C9A|nr:Rpn family recombination-promoting nuclease/putative transposase [Polyangium sp. 6x1]MDI1450190.1 Rpn family recombination-promoting nuclease/putative transposase [Polyangium sp. 6x1]
MTDNPHDALFQYVFSNPEHAGPALRTMLPAALVQAIDFSTLALSPGHFVDPELDGHRSDLLFSAKLSGRDALIYVLWEHQSYVDTWLPLRLLEYMVRIWRSYRDEHPRAKKVPVIVPVVLHHSKTGWRAARRFEELVDVDAAGLSVLEHVPRFEFVLDDISHVDDAELSRRAMTMLGRLVLYLFRHARDPEELFAGLGRWAEALRQVMRAPDGETAIKAVMEYLRSVGKRDEVEVVMAVKKVVGDSAFDRIFYAGERIEQYKRWQEERAKEPGKRELLARQLKLRFGELPASAQEALDAATFEELDGIAERILTASTLAEVLGEATQRRGHKEKEPEDPFAWIVKALETAESTKPPRKSPTRKSPQRRTRGR